MACAAPVLPSVQSLARQDQSTVLGLASHYGSRLHGRRTASGEKLDKMSFTAASNRFPLGSLVLVRRLDNTACAVVRINDRMSRQHRLRIIDVTHEAGRHLGMLRAGVVRVELSLLPAEHPPGPVECQALLAELPGEPAVHSPQSAQSCPNCRSTHEFGLAGQGNELDHLHLAEPTPAKRLPAPPSATEVSSP